MHDARGRELRVGDQVLIPAVVTDVSATEEYCNVQLRTVYGRRPDGIHERIQAINTAVLHRSNDGDDNRGLFDVEHAPAVARKDEPDEEAPVPPDQQKPPLTEE